MLPLLEPSSLCGLILIGLLDLIFLSGLIKLMICNFLNPSNITINNHLNRAQEMNDSLLNIVGLFLIAICFQEIKIVLKGLRITFVIILILFEFFIMENVFVDLFNFVIYKVQYVLQHYVEMLGA